MRLLKLIFRLIYKTYIFLSSYSDESYLNSRLVEYPYVIENLYKYSNGSRILLVGCAGDPLSTILPALGYKTYGIDVKHIAIKYPHFKFVKVDIRRTNFADNFFDAVVAVSTIEHVGMHEQDYDGDKNAMKEIARILKPEGSCIITIPVVSRFRISLLERYYDIKALKMLIKGWDIHEMSFFKVNKDGYWMKCSSNELPDQLDKAIARLVLKR